MERRKQNGRGFTIIEALVIVIILGVLAAVVGPRLLSRIGQSKQAVAQSNAAALSSAMKLFSADHGLPEAGSPITILYERPSYVEESAWNGPYVDSMDALKDPWGNLFVLVIPGQHNVDFDIMSYGADGVSGGEGDNADIIAGKR
ncbi:MAG: type II secretion system major pseudopilin GspG [Phycisphaerales bacterium]|nr:type II secretion system major pseudopilin GspG [Phycisphaerales bacterium]